jgi:hypothetical protein
MKIQKGTWIILAIVGGAIFLTIFAGGGKGFQHGFYSADYAGHQGVQSSKSYVASSGGVGGA